MIYDGRNTILLPVGENLVFDVLSNTNNFWIDIAPYDKNKYYIFKNKVAKLNYINNYFYKSYLFLGPYKNIISNVYRRLKRHGEHNIGILLNLPKGSLPPLYNDNTGVSLHANYIYAMINMKLDNEKVYFFRYEEDIKDYNKFYNIVIKSANEESVLPDQFEFDKILKYVNLKYNIYFIVFSHNNTPISDTVAALNGVIDAIIIVPDTVLSIPASMIMASEIVKDIEVITRCYGAHIKVLYNRLFSGIYKKVLNCIENKILNNNLDISIFLNLYAKMATDTVDVLQDRLHVKIKNMRFPIFRIFRVNNNNFWTKMLINKIFLMNFHVTFKLYSPWYFGYSNYLKLVNELFYDDGCSKDKHIDLSSFKLKSRDEAVKLDINKTVFSNYSVSFIWNTHRGLFTLRNIALSFLRKYYKAIENSNINLSNPNMCITITAYPLLLGWHRISDE